MEFNGKTIWITGATSGIGKAMALHIANQGVSLILSGRNLDSLKVVATICEYKGSKVQVIPFDLSDSKSVEHAAQTALKSNHKIDCLYQVGGISQRSFVEDTSLEVDRKIMEVNFFGTIALVKAVLPSMIKSGGGYLAVTSSIVGKFGFPYRSAYSASKHALHGFFESLRAENVANNIKVSIIIPGRVKTQISVNALDRDGKAHNKMDDGQAQGMSVEKCAHVICRKLKKEKKEILVGGKEIMMVHIRRFLPALYYKLSSKVEPL